MINFSMKVVKNKAKTKKVRPLKRPIILIANDAFTPALKQLRDMCLMVRIREADNDRLLKRLRVIIKSENMRIDDKVLRDLAESTGNDVRSCINSLQFLSGLRQEESIQEEQVA